MRRSETSETLLNGLDEAALIGARDARARARAKVQPPQPACEKKSPSTEHEHHAGIVSTEIVDPHPLDGLVVAQFRQVSMSTSMETRC
eukprot:COSAG02_NODE_1099_length_14585_cov_19.264669_4_plen_88_part_00